MYLHAHAQQARQPEPRGREVFRRFCRDVTAQQRGRHPAARSDALRNAGEERCDTQHRLRRAEQKGIKPAPPERAPHVTRAGPVHATLERRQRHGLVDGRDASRDEPRARRAEQGEARLGESRPQGAQQGRGLERLADAPGDQHRDVHARQSTDSGSQRGLNVATDPAL